MFNFFKRQKTEFRADDLDALRNIILNLPEKYSYLVEQISSDFILGKKPNPLGDKGTYTLLLNANLENRYSSKSLPRFFIIRDFRIWDSKKSKWQSMELHILEGMIAGYKSDAELRDLDLGRIDVSGIKEKHFRDEDKEELDQIIGDVDESLKALLDLQSTFKIEIEEGTFWIIKDLHDGNYLGIDKWGAVYGLIHDPYLVEKIYDKKQDFFDALRSGLFNIREYYNSKIS